MKIKRLLILIFSVTGFVFIPYFLGVWNVFNWFPPINIGGVFMVWGGGFIYLLALALAIFIIIIFIQIVRWVIDWLMGRDEC
jgi:hypothetical protein